MPPRQEASDKKTRDSLVFLIALTVNNSWRSAGFVTEDGRFDEILNLVEHGSIYK